MGFCLAYAVAVAYKSANALSILGREGTLLGQLLAITMAAGVFWSVNHLLKAAETALLYSVSVRGRVSCPSTWMMCQPLVDCTGWLISPICNAKAADFELCNHNSAAEPSQVSPIILAACVNGDLGCQGAEICTVY